MTEPSHSPSLPEVSFYVLATQDQQQRQDFACKLIEKIYRSGYFPYVLTDSAEQAEQIDNALWTFRAGSFIPHQIYRGEIPAFTGTILIGSENIPDGWQKIVVNLSSLYPPTTAPTERILEILDNSEECKQAGRQRYRHYQQAELAITTHKM
jgi:DNA polymerase-3 subunit chi